MTEPEHPPRDLPRSIRVLVIVSVAANVILAVAIGVLAWIGLARIHASQIDACHQSNTARVRDVAIWNRLLTLSPQQQAQQTAAQRTEVRQLEHLVKVKDTLVNCHAQYRLGG